MAELTAIGYRSGRSVLHALDVRVKLIGLILISISTLYACPIELGLMTLLIIAALNQMGVSFLNGLKALRFFLIFILFVFFARVLSTPVGGQIPVIHISVIKITSKGLYEAWIVCWRLLVVVISSMAFVSSTRPSEIKTAVQWVLGPVPGIPAKRIAVMLSLIIRFIPVIFSQTKETMDAQRARGVENRKNPIYRLIKLTIPVFRRIFKTADELVLAMEARCYSENRRDPKLSADKKDWIALLVIIGMAFAVIQIG